MKLPNPIVVILFMVLTAVARAQVLADFTVAADGSGNYKTVQEAINAVPDFRKNRTTIFIKPGVQRKAGAPQIQIERNLYWRRCTDDHSHL